MYFLAVAQVSVSILSSRHFNIQLIGLVQIGDLLDAAKRPEPPEYLLTTFQNNE
jgi:hypothetical protein